MMGCADTQKFIHVYLDGEFGEEDRVEMEAHLGSCPSCRQLAQFESSFRAAVRGRLRTPPAPPELRARILGALDEADAAGAGPVPPLWRRALPAAALAAAATIVLVVGVGLLSGRGPGRGLIEEAVRVHEKNLPLEVDGSEDRVKQFFSSRVPVPVRPPRLTEPGTSLVGGRLGHLRGRDTAQLVYRVHESPVTVHVFDAADLPLPGQRRSVGGRDYFVDSARGYSVVIFRDRGVGYAFTSDIAENDMLQLVSTAVGP